jgi:hypothetical protein
LKGTAPGGHLNMENFTTGCTGHEHEYRAAMARVLAKEKAVYFSDRFVHYFFTDEDAEFFASLGLNFIHVPFNYRHVIDDADPTVLKPDDFKLLDNIVDISTGSIWLYKDLGYQGMIYALPDSPYMKLIAPFVEEKAAARPRLLGSC